MSGGLRLHEVVARLGGVLQGDGAERDDRVQIGHNVSIGEQAAVAGCVGVAGSTRMDRRCAAGATGMIIGYLELGDDVHISAGIMVTRSLPRIGQ